MTGRILFATGAVTLVMIGPVAGPIGAVASDSVPGSRAAASISSPQVAARCTQLTRNQPANAIVDRAEFVAGETVVPPLNDKNGREFCQVFARLAPVAGSEIRVKLRFPSCWNGEFVGFVDGGFEGGFATATLAPMGPVDKGYSAMVKDKLPEAKPPVEQRGFTNRPDAAQVRARTNWQIGIRGEG